MTTTAKKKIRVGVGDAMFEWLDHHADMYGLSKGKVVLACIQVSLISPRRLDKALRRLGGDLVE